MTRTVSLFALVPALLAAASLSASAAELSPGQQAVQSAAEQGQFAFVLFYRGNDAATSSMQQTLTSTLAQRSDAAIVSVQVTDPAERSLIAHFDATRLPLPAVAVLAPNGAVTSVFPRRVAAQQLTAAIVSSGQADCLKALQEQKIVLLCVHPEGTSSIPQGVQEFQADELYLGRTELVSVQANDPQEAKFLGQLKVRTDQPTTTTVLMAPPGVMLGMYNANVTHQILARKLVDAGKCCDDPNCKHRKAAGSGSAPRR